MTRIQFLNNACFFGFLFFSFIAQLSSMAWAQHQHSHHNNNEPSETLNQDLYTCPMHPQIVESTEGTCPICGMDLVAKTLAKVKDTGPLQKGDIHIDPIVVQNMGIRTALVEKGTLYRHVRTVGTIDIAESSLSVINLRYSGWVERIYVDKAGAYIKKGQALFDIYSPELISAQEEFLLALRSGGPNSALLKSAHSRLSFWNLSSTQIDRIARQNQALRTNTVNAPQSGYVLHKNIVQGARIQAGTDLYRIGNLNNIWVNTDIYEFDAPWIKVGQRAIMELPFQKGHSYESQVAYIYPTLNMKTRTLRVRLEFQNPGLELKPGMFATVQIEANRHDNVLYIPHEAIIHSGLRQLVFVVKDWGKYSPREITTGLVGDNHLTEVLSGLEQGERIVSSGQFLLDSESQLNEAIQKLLADRLKAKIKAEPKNTDPEIIENKQTEFWTCGMHPQILEEKPGTCPICGMNLTLQKN